MKTQIKRAAMTGLLLAAGTGVGACISPQAGVSCDEWCPENYLCVPVGENMSVQKFSCVPSHICGNGIREGDEKCDDGNSADGDGCNNQCHIEFCRNGILEEGEECDDGNSADGDGCNNQCHFEFCGNGILEGDEECDDGNSVDDAECDSNCTRPRCGNGILEGAEACDDGNSVNGDNCSSTCEIVPNQVEIEPNDWLGSANGPFTRSVVIHGGQSATDVDVFQFSNQNTSSVMITFDTWSEDLGIGTPCGGSTDTVLEIADQSGEPIGFSDDRSSGDFCSTMTVTVAAGATAYVALSPYYLSDEIYRYLLVATYGP